jgi:hypothetical protein
MRGGSCKNKLVERKKRVLRKKLSIFAKERVK